MAWVEWKVPCLPVKPWQMTRVSELIQTLAEEDMKRAPEVVAVALELMALAAVAAAIEVVVGAVMAMPRRAADAAMDDMF